ncbi:MAG: DNA-binding protein [Desulforegulaceae bacterium]|jgi:hypothetical protein|nr:DNA-binding protein [Desulforegulaceae bacterium]
MSLVQSVESKAVYMGRLSHGCDLLMELTKICEEKSITLGKITAIGAVKKAVLGYYNTDKFEYEDHIINEPMELLNLTGNVSLKDGKTMVHCHVTLSDKSGKALGGHLFPETIVFACEYIIEKFDGNKLSREFDKETGLALWPVDKS